MTIWKFTHDTGKTLYFDSLENAMGHIRGLGERLPKHLTLITIMNSISLHPVFRCEIATPDGMLGAYLTQATEGWAVRNEREEIVAVFEELEDALEYTVSKTYYPDSAHRLSMPKDSKIFAYTTGHLRWEVYKI